MRNAILDTVEERMISWYSSACRLSHATTERSCDNVRNNGYTFSFPVCCIVLFGLAMKNWVYVCGYCLVSVFPSRIYREHRVSILSFPPWLWGLFLLPFSCSAAYLTKSVYQKVTIIKNRCGQCHSSFLNFGDSQFFVPKDALLEEN